MYKKITILSLVLSVSALMNVSCATKSGKGAVIGAGGGAAIGAGIGALIGGKKGALIGGSIGAVTGGASGAAIGGYMDKQEKKLRKNVDHANIERVGNELIVRFDSGMLFDSGQASLKTASQNDLTKFAKVLKDFDKTNVSIEGHTDSTGSNALNQRLSKSRASSVATYLGSQGVMGTRLATMGYASSRPVADNTTPEGRQANRRVEVKITPNQELVDAVSKK